MHIFSIFRRKTIRQKYKINAPAKKVWDALTVPAHINSWGGGPARMDDKEGTDFTLWDGDIRGRNIEVVPMRTLKQEWFGGEWEKPSILIFSLDERSGSTILRLTQEHVPDDDMADIKEGWKEYYIGPLKKYVEKNNNSDLSSIISAR